MSVTLPCVEVETGFELLPELELLEHPVSSDRAKIAHNVV
jgi:hypothetical protein